MRDLLTGILTLIVATPILGQLPQVRTAIGPTDYDSCVQADIVNLQVVQQVSRAATACYFANAYSRQVPVCQVRGVQFTTYTPCVAALARWCQAEAQRDSANQECRDAVRRFKEAQALFDSDDKEGREHDKVRKFLWDLTANVSQVGKRTLPWPANRIFASQMSRAARVNDNVLSSLTAALNELDNLGVSDPGYRPGVLTRGVPPPPSSQWEKLRQSNPEHPLVALASAVLADPVDPNTRDIRSLRLEDMGLSVGRLYAAEGSATAATLVGRAHARWWSFARDTQAAEAWLLQGAALGDPQAAAHLGSLYVYLGGARASSHQLRNAREWLEIGSSHGSAHATASLAALYWKQGDRRAAERVASRLPAGHPSLRDLPFQLPARAQDANAAVPAGIFDGSPGTKDSGFTLEGSRYACTIGLNKLMLGESTSWQERKTALIREGRMEWQGELVRDWQGAVVRDWWDKDWCGALPKLKPGTVLFDGTTGECGNYLKASFTVEADRILGEYLYRAVHGGWQYRAEYSCTRVQ